MQGQDLQMQTQRLLYNSFKWLAGWKQQHSSVLSLSDKLFQQMFRLKEGFMDS